MRRGAVASMPAPAFTPQRIFRKPPGRRDPPNSRLGGRAFHEYSARARAHPASCAVRLDRRLFCPGFNYRWRGRAQPVRGRLQRRPARQSSTRSASFLPNLCFFQHNSGFAYGKHSPVFMNRQCVACCSTPRWRGNAREDPPRPDSGDMQTRYPDHAPESGIRSGSFCFGDEKGQFAPDYGL